MATSSNTRSEDQARDRAIRGVTVWGALANLLLAALKGTAGVLGGSSVMVADAVHSLSDLGSDVVALFTLRLASKPPDEDHPYGHGRYETLGAVLLSFILIGAAAGIAYDAIDRFGQGSEPGMIALWAAVASVVVKEILYQITARVGRRYDSPLVIANAWHHRSDALSSVAALGGIVGARMGFPILDPVAAVVVAALIIGMALKILRASTREFLGANLERHILRQLSAGVSDLSGVVSLHKLRARRMGPRVLIDLHVQVDGGTTVSDGHQVAERVRRFVFAERSDVSEVLVHIDPEDDSDEGANPLWRPRAELEAEVREVAQTVESLRAVGHVLVHYLREGVVVHLSIYVPPELTVREAAAVAAELRQKVETITDVDQADVHLELTDPGATAQIRS